MIGTECGVSGPDMLKSLEKVKGIEPKGDQYISVVSSGLCSRHTFVVFNDNTLHAFGWNQVRTLCPLSQTIQLNDRNHICFVYFQWSLVRPIW